MSDLISRDALLEAISNTWEESNSLSIINLIANAPAIEQGELVKKAVADALEEAAKICDDLEYKNNRYDCAGCGDAIRTIIKRNAEECQ